jgi:hypothetical protein
MCKPYQEEVKGSDRLYGIELRLYFIAYHITICIMHFIHSLISCQKIVLHDDIFYSKNFLPNSRVHSMDRYLLTKSWTYTRSVSIY